MSRFQRVASSFNHLRPCGKEVEAFDTQLVGATPETKEDLEAKRAASKEAAVAMERKLLPDGRVARSSKLFIPPDRFCRN